MLGRAAPAGSKDVGVIYRSGPNGTKIPITEEAGKVRTFVRDSSGEPGKHWRSAVAEAGQKAMAGRPPFDGPLYVELTLIRLHGPGHFGQGRNVGRLLPSAPAFPAVKPDVLKLTRSTEDALTGVVWRDDSRNCALHIEKVFAEEGEPPGAHVRVWELPGTLKAQTPPEQLALA